MKKFLLPLFLYSILTFGQMPKLSSDAQVSLLTCGRGEELYSTFGHTALRIKDTANQLDVVYNYGMFDFRTENFYLKFVKGDLQYYMNITSFEDFLFEYQMTQREVVEQQLSFSTVQKQQLFDNLNADLFSANKFYTYKFIDRNCTTKVADQISKLLPSKLQKVDNKNISYRELLYPYFENYFWYKLGINVIFGYKTDEKATQLFLPVELMNSVEVANKNGGNLEKSREVIVKGSTIEKEFSFVNSIYLVLIVLLLLLMTNSTKVYKGFLFISGLLGVFLCLVGLYSQHEEVLWNYNALLFSPLFILFPFFKDKKLKIIVKISLALLLLYCIILFDKAHILLMLPFIGTILIMLLKISGKELRNLLPSVKKDRT